MSNIFDGFGYFHDKMLKRQNKEIKEPISRDLFDILACPLCKADLEYTKDKKGLSCSKCGAKYPIQEGIPILLPPKDRKTSK